MYTVERCCRRGIQHRLNDSDGESIRPFFLLLEPDSCHQLLLHCTIALPGATPRGACASNAAKGTSSRRTPRAARPTRTTAPRTPRHVYNIYGEYMHAPSASTYLIAILYQCVCSKSPCACSKKLSTYYTLVYGNCL